MFQGVWNFKKKSLIVYKNNLGVKPKVLFSTGLLYKIQTDRYMLDLGGSTPFLKTIHIKSGEVNTL
jgi:hypothetical protein